MESDAGAANKIPILTVKAGPKDKNWPDRLKEEYLALIEYVKHNQEEDNEWFQIEPNSDGTKWKGKCWYYHNFQKFEFDLQFEVTESINLDPRIIPRYSY
jgi:ufm1-conjugating enzyme 1